ncbi:MAG: hypothetical protein RMI49_02380 [Candidatus Caldarchaeum sp.]|nr:hypothetical protein [Candidatus Caldarchaeum sp.]
MSGLAEKVRSELAKLKDPVSNVPLLFVDAEIDVQESSSGDIYIVYIPKNPYSPHIITNAEAVKSIASKIAGQRRVVVEVRNHVMADFLNMKLNG